MLASVSYHFYECSGDCGRRRRRRIGQTHYNIMAQTVVMVEQLRCVCMCPHEVPFQRSYKRARTNMRTQDTQK